MSEMGGAAMSGSNVVLGPRLAPRFAQLSGDTLVDLLDAAVARTPDRVALVIRRDLRDERWSYRHLGEVVERVAARLAAAGVMSGSRVLTWSPNDPWLVAAYFAVWRLGAVVVPLDQRMQTDVAIRIGRTARASLLLAGPDVDQASVAAFDVPILSVDQAGLDPAGAPAGRLPSRAAVASSDLAEIIFTSGTTSDPKGVTLTHGQIIHSARAIAQTAMGSRPDRALAVVPLSHMYGQVVPLLMGFMSGSTLVFLHALSPKALGAAMRRERITALTLTPHLMSNLLQGLEAEARRSGREASLRRGRLVARWLPRRLRRIVFRPVLQPLGGALDVISSGGAMLPVDLQRSFEAFGVRVIQGYGTSEVAVITGHSRRRQRAGTVGPPLPGMEVRIGEDGELLARGPNVMLGYWEAPAATADVLDTDGWFHTGDAARVDEHGELVILGRTRDRIALPSGLKVYPEDVERALVQTAAVRGAVVVEPAPGRLAAALLPATGSTSEEELAAAVREANATLAPHQRVRSWRRWPEVDLPRTHTMKVRRQPVQEWLAGGGHAAGESGGENGGADERGGAATGSALSALDDGAIARVVAGVLADVRGTDPGELSAASRLEDLDLDSLSAVSLALGLEAAFDAPVTDDDVLGATDIAALREIVARRQGQEPGRAPSDWAFSSPARAARRALDATLVGWAIDVVADLRVEGTEHLEQLTGPALICPNHSSHLDAPVVRAALPAALRDRSVIAAAADYWFGGRIAGLAVGLALGAVPFGRTSDVRASLEHVAELVNRGHTVIIFPEGTRSVDGRLGTLRQGIGLLATRLRVPIVPVAIDGTHEILPKGSSWPTHRHRRSVSVRFGAPLRFAPEVSVPQATTRVADALASLQLQAPRDRALADS